MIGKQPSRTKPTILFVSDDKATRKEALNLIKRQSMIMEDHQGFELGHIPLKAEFEGLKQMADGSDSSICWPQDVPFHQYEDDESPCHDIHFTSRTQDGHVLPAYLTTATASGLIQTVNSGSLNEGTISIVIDQGSSTGCQKLHAFVGGAKKTKRSATAGGLVSFRGRPMFQTVQHLLEEEFIPTNINISAHPNDLDDESDDYEITGWSDSENDDDEPDLADITSLGSISPQSETANAAEWDTIADEASTIFSRPAQEEHDNELVSTHQKLVLSTTQVPSMDQRSSAIATGEVVLSSKELDFALVEVSPSVLLQLGEAEAQAQVVPLEKYLDYVESTLFDAAVEVDTPEGESIGGTLSGTPCLFRPPGSREFIEVYTAKLSRPMVSGECGSWLRNAVSGKIYGHVIAGSLSTNLAMIVPAHQVLGQALEILEFCEAERMVGEVDQLQGSKRSKVGEFLQDHQQDHPEQRLMAESGDGDGRTYHERQTRRYGDQIDPFAVATGIIASATFAFTSCTAFHGLIRSLQSQNKDARALKAEVGDLAAVLSSLLETIASNPNLDFEVLKQPLQRCGQACEEYGKIIAQCTKHSNETSRPSVRDWIAQRYLQGDINDFKDMLSAHKSTINIALANANLRIAAVSPEVLDSYKDMIADTTCDLKMHLQDMQEKIDRLKAGDIAAVDEVALEWYAMMEEKESIKHGLDMCARLSAQISEFEAASAESARYAGRPSAHKHIKTSLSQAGQSIKSLVGRLQSHEALVSSQLEAMSLQGALSEPVASQLERLQQTKESLSQCISIVSEAGELANERSNVFEDLTLSDNSYAFSVSTVNDLVTARRLKLNKRSRHFAGRVTAETLHQGVQMLSQLDNGQSELWGDAESHMNDPTVAVSATSVGLKKREDLMAKL
ncbi:hypothetical protein K4K57_009360 [Colletotrichum sp. SAR 10_99]|nr:hypothetical protein K4K55_004726 [Colletotrichum sp. SAR 10_96]KAJ5009129.1 hypothetical protein K4K57_009360 [Colletotrichum sp. SAR 10_99]